MNSLVGKLVTVKKITDEKFNNQHPNGVNTGYSASGVVKVVSPYLLIINDNGHYFHTSAIKSFDKKDENNYTINTLNSVYELSVEN